MTDATIDATARDAFQRAGEAIAAAWGELAQALDKTQDDFTLTEGGPK